MEFSSSLPRMLLYGTPLTDHQLTTRESLPEVYLHEKYSEIFLFNPLILFFERNKFQYTIIVFPENYSHKLKINKSKVPPTSVVCFTTLRKFNSNSIKFKQE